MDKVEENNKENAKEELDETNSTGSDEIKEGSGSSGSNKKETNGKWKTDFKKLRRGKKVPKLLHALSVPIIPINLNPPKQFLNPPPSPEIVPDKQDPNRFYGDGENYKGKIIGIKEVGQNARGDKLAQEALIELKANSKLSNTHKQKIIINISVDGVKIKDEKGINVLHHHPVHKISFIAQDVVDLRAFGYVSGHPATGHTFLAIKTEKAADQVVYAMKDLFQTVFDLRKKEMQERAADTQTNIEPNKDKSEKKSEEILKSNGVSEQEVKLSAGDDDVDSAKVGLNLLDLDAEFKISEPRKSVTAEDDFFGAPASNDPFFADPLTFINSISSSITSTSVSQLTVSNASSSRKFSFEDSFSDTPAAFPEETPPPPLTFNTNFDNFSTSTPNAEFLPTTNPFGAPDRYAPLADLSKGPFNDAFVTTAISIEATAEMDLASSNEYSLPSKPVKGEDLFSDLDPLGKDRPFVDKKDFFHEVKNPPKKVLKDLVEASRRSSSPPSSETSSCSGMSSQSVGSLPLSSSPPPPTFAVTFPTIDQISSGASSPLAISDIGPFEQQNGSNSFRDQYFDDEFSLPSPVTPPPPPPTAPAPPPRPITILPPPPPLPPKRPSTSNPIIKLDPSETKTGDTLKRISRPVGTLPIPIPARRTRGAVPGPNSSPKPVPRSNGIDCTNPSPCVTERYANTPDTSSSFTSVSSLSQQSSENRSLPHMVSSTPEKGWMTSNGNSSPAFQSPILPPPPPPNSLSNGVVDNRCNFSFSVTATNNNNNNNNDSFDNRKNSVEFDMAWKKATSSESSIFHRSSDPFADDFFTSLSEDHGASSVECRNKLNQQNWMGGRNIDPFVVNGER